MISLKSLSKLSDSKPAAHLKVKDSTAAYKFHRGMTSMCQMGDNIVFANPLGVDTKDVSGQDKSFVSSWELLVLNQKLETLSSTPLEFKGCVRSLNLHAENNTLFVFIVEKFEQEPLYCNIYNLKKEDLTFSSQFKADFKSNKLGLDFRDGKALINAFGFIYYLNLGPKKITQGDKVKFTSPENDKDLTFTPREACFNDSGCTLLSADLDDRDRSWTHLSFYDTSGELVAEKSVYNKGGFRICHDDDNIVYYWDNALTVFDVSNLKKPKALGSVKLWSKIKNYLVHRAGDLFIGFGDGNTLKLADLSSGKLQKADPVKLKHKADEILFLEGAVAVLDYKKGLHLYKV